MPLILLNSYTGKKQNKAQSITIVDQDSKLGSYQHYNSRLQLIRRIINTT